MNYGVIFDMDGVLVDSYQPHFESWRQVAAECGLTMTEREFATTFGRTSREIIAHFWGEGMKTDAQIAAMDDRKEAMYRKIIRDHFPAMDGAAELLAALRAAGFALAIGSSGPPANVAVVIDALAAQARAIHSEFPSPLPSPGGGGENLFDATVNGMEVVRGKPDPQVFLLAAGKLRLPPSRCAVVEDAVAGVRAARAAGAAVIALTGTARRTQLAPLADRVVDSLRELTPADIAALIDANANR